MKLKAITNEEEYDYWLNWVDGMMDKQVQPGTANGDRFQIVLLIIKDYEDRNYPVPAPDPIEAIKLKMEEKGLKSKDLTTLLGVGKSYISAILSRKKPMTMQIAKILHHELGISAEALLA